MPTTTPEGAAQEFFHVFNRRDIETVMALYEPQPVMVAQPDQVAGGQAAVREALNRFLAMKPTLAPQRNRIVTAGDLALSILKWTLQGTGQNGQPVQMEGTSTDVFRKQADGRWLFGGSPSWVERPKPLRRASPRQLWLCRPVGTGHGRLLALAARYRIVILGLLR